jgi:hypothetical protein
VSYRQSYSATISGTVHGTVSIPASDRPSSKSVSLPWSEHVNIDILVDTSSFDYSISSIKHHVDALTGSVAATEAIQIEEKSKNAMAISRSVTRGFFDLIRSEITQQMAELRSRVDSLFIKLRDMKLASQRVKQTMQQDYGRITDRYTSTFEELDKELAMRIASLDESAYTFRRDAILQARRSFDSTLSAVPTVFGKENSQAQTALQAGIMHNRMHTLLQLASAYLLSEKRTSQVFSKILSAERIVDSTTHSLPVAFLATDDPAAGSMEKAIFPSGDKSPFDDVNIMKSVKDQFQLKNRSWKPMTSEDGAQIERFLVPLIDAMNTSTPERDRRVCQMILRLWRAYRPETLMY